MIVLSHPRSGSSELVRILKSRMSLGNSVNYCGCGEAFNLTDPSMYGDTRTAIRHFRDIARGAIPPSPITLTLKTLKPGAIVTEDLIPYAFESLLESSTFTFNTLQELEKFLAEEMVVRYKSIKNSTVPLVLKHFFITSTLDKGDQSKGLVLNLLQDSDYMFYYRNNFYGSILSGLIHDLHVKTKAHNTLSNLGIIQLPSVPIEINVWYLREKISPYINFLKFFKEWAATNEVASANVITYDDVFFKMDFNILVNSLTLNVNELHVKIANNEFKREERMQYADKRENFFSNPELIPIEFEQYLKDNDLFGVVEQLKIQWKPN